MAERAFDELPKRIVGELDRWIKDYGFDFDAKPPSYQAMVWAKDFAEKRVPEAPAKIRPGRYVKSVGQCPSCSRLVDTSGDYCKHCGKALDWREEKKG